METEGKDLEKKNIVSIWQQYGYLEKTKIIKNLCFSRERKNRCSNAYFKSVSMVTKQEFKIHV